MAITTLQAIDAAIIKLVSGNVQTITVSLPGGQSFSATALDLDKLRLLRREFQAFEDLDNGYDTVSAEFSRPS